MPGLAGTSARQAAVYIADAPYQALPLIGGQHDWAYILAGNLEAAPAIAAAVVFLAWMLAVGGVGACALGLARATALAQAPASPTPI